MNVQLNDGTVLNIEKLPLGKYADLLGAFQELPKHLNDFKEFKGLTTDQFIQMIPQLLSTCLPDFIRIIKIATNLTEEQVEALGLDEATEILIAIYTVNNYQAVYEKLKKLAAPKIQVVENPTIPENTTPTS